MTVRYYLTNILIGLIGVIVLGYGWYEDPHNHNELLWLVFAVVSWLAFPFARFAIESIALRFTTKDFWHSGFFKDDIGKNGIVAIYWVFCFFLAIPLFFLSIPFLKKRLS